MTRLSAPDSPSSNRHVDLRRRRLPKAALGRSRRAVFSGASRRALPTRTGEDTVTRRRTAVPASAATRTRSISTFTPTPVKAAMGTATRATACSVAECFAERWLSAVCEKPPTDSRVSVGRSSCADRLLRAGFGDKSTGAVRLSVVTGTACGTRGEEQLFLITGTCRYVHCPWQAAGKDVAAEPHPADRHLSARAAAGC